MSIRVLIAVVTITTATIGMGGAAAAADTGQPTAKQPIPSKVTVQPGDNLSNIGQAHDTNYIRLFDANTNIDNPALIFPGEVVRIPSADEQLPDRPLPADQATAAVAVTSAAPEPTTGTLPVNTQASPPSRVVSGGNGVWDELAACESGGNWAAATGNGYYGGLQFTMSSWAAAGGSGSPAQASPSEQIARAEILQSRQGWSAWPACAAKLGL